MQEEPIINKYTGTDYLDASGPVEIGLTNDYMFRVVFQENKFALKGLISSILHLEPDAIRSLEIKNAIQPGASISSKEYRMDILVSLNNGTIIDIEMQLTNYGNWECRSLSYLCREFDNLTRGTDYSEVAPVYQISFLDFTLFEDHPEFCATYQMRNAKDNYLYTDRFNLIVIELNHEELATKEDIASGITDWVRLFKSKTWEELKMIAQDNEYLTSTVESIYLSNIDENIRRAARERDDFLREQAIKDAKMERLSEENENLIAENEKQAAEMKKQAAEMKKQAAELERLRKLLEANGIKPE